jgi:hypothetical protein
MGISRRRPRLSLNSPEFIRDAFRLLQPILLAYSDQYRFRQSSIYLDSKIAPLRHIKSYYLLARLCEESHIKSFQAFPLRSSWLPGYLQIDTKILRLYFLHDNNPRMANKMGSWRHVVDLQATAFKPQVEKSSLVFQAVFILMGLECPS